MQTIRATRALAAGGWMRDADIRIADDGRIASVSGKSGKADIQVGLLLPAPVNLHSHSFQRAMAGLTESRGPDASDSFWTWRELMYRFLRQLTPDQVETIAQQAFMEMAEAGYSAVAEFHYLHHNPDGQPYDSIAELSERIAAAAQASGLGLTLLPVHYEFGGCDGRPLQGGQMRFGNSRDRFSELHAASSDVVSAGPSDWNIGVAPHSLRAVDPAGLAQAQDLAAGGPFHMHLAEQVAEVEEVQASLGARPVEWVLGNLPVNERCCFIHCTQMTLDETRRLAGSGAVAGLCPITESSLGDGTFNGAAYLGAGGDMGIGSDSNVHIGLWDELRTLEYSQRLRDRGRAVLATPHMSTGRALFEAALHGGAKAAGRSSGCLKPGLLADLVAVSTDNEFLCDKDEDTLLDGLVFSGGGQRCVTDLWSAGRHIVQGGRHVMREKITSRFMSVLRELELET